MMLLFAHHKVLQKQNQNEQTHSLTQEIIDSMKLTPNILVNFSFHDNEYFYSVNSVQF